MPSFLYAYFSWRSFSWSIFTTALELTLSKIPEQRKLQCRQTALPRILGFLLLYACCFIEQWKTNEDFISLIEKTRLRQKRFDLFHFFRT